MSILGYNNTMKKLFLAILAVFLFASCTVAGSVLLTGCSQSVSEKSESEEENSENIEDPTETENDSEESAEEEDSPFFDLDEPEEDEKVETNVTTYYIPAQEIVGTSNTSVSSSYSWGWDPNGGDYGSYAPWNTSATSVDLAGYVTATYYDANDYGCAQTFGTSFSASGTVTLTAPSIGGYYFAGWYSLYYWSESDYEEETCKRLTTSRTYSFSASSLGLDANYTLQAVYYRKSSQTYWGYSTGTYASSFAGGSGTESDPYQIATALQLARLSYLSNSSTYYSTYIAAYYEITADIDLSSYLWRPIGLAHPFYGQIDGNGHIISGMSCLLYSGNYSSTSYYCHLSINYLGFVARMYAGTNGQLTGNGTIKNIIFKDPNIRVDSMTHSYNAYVGIAAAYTSGSSSNNVNIQNVGVIMSNNYSTCRSISINYTSFRKRLYVGGLVGYGEGFNMQESFCSGLDISTSVTSSSSTNGFFGGLVGLLNSESTISNSYFSGTLYCGGYNVGGIAGSCGGDIENCYAKGYGTAYASNTGGIAGYLGGTIRSCFTYFSINGNGTEGGLVGRIAVGGYVYASRYYSGYSSSVYGTSSGTVSTSGSYSSSTLPVSSNGSSFYTSTSYLKASGYGTAWDIHTSPATSSYYMYTWSKYNGNNTDVNDGFPVLSWALKRVRLSARPSGQTTLNLKVESSENVDSGSSTSTAYVYALIGENICVSTEGYEVSEWKWDSTSGDTFETDSQMAVVVLKGGERTTSVSNMYQYIYALGEMTATVKYYSVTGTNTSSTYSNVKVQLSTSSSTTTLSSGGKTGISATYSSTVVTITVSRASTSYNWFIYVGTSSGTTVTTSHSRNSATYSWTPKSSGITIYIKLAQSYTITYNANGGSGTLPSTQYKVYGTAVTLGSNNLTRTNYTPNGWNTNSSGTGTAYANGASYTRNASVTLYAAWEVAGVTVTVNLRVINEAGGGGTSNSNAGGRVSVTYRSPSGSSSTSATATQTSASAQYTHHSGQTFRITATAKSGYVFAGFSTSSTPSSSIKNPSGTVSTTKSYTPTASATYYVYFKAVSDNLLKYDETFDYFYFEDGEYPQSYAGTYSSMQTSLTSTGNTIRFVEPSGRNSGVPVYRNSSGTRYAVVTAPQTCTIELTESDGSTRTVSFTSGSRYCFEFEPIRWRITDYGISGAVPSDWDSYTAYNTNFTAVSDLILGASAMNSTTNVSEGTSVTSMGAYTNLRNSGTYCDFSLDFGASDSIDVDRYNPATSGNAVSSTTTTYSAGLRLVSNSDLEEVGFVNSDARASHMVAMLLGKDDTKCSYWTRNLSNLGSGVAISASGTEIRPWLDEYLGLRYAYRFNEGSNIDY